MPIDIVSRLGGETVPAYRIVTLATIAAICCGCGTVKNTTGWTGLLHSPETPQCEVYGGIRKDLEGGQELFLKRPNAAERDDTLSPQPNSVQDLADYVDGHLKCMAFWAVDLPLTFVGDTLTLPLTIQKTLEKRSNPSPPETKISP